MATQIRVRYMTRDVQTWQSPSLTPEDFGGTDEDSDEILRGKVFRSMNAIEGDPAFEVCIRLRVRSMMVGDQVAITRGKEHAVYSCECVGWMLVA